jgi:hypothetical protein
MESYEREKNSSKRKNSVIQPYLSFTIGLPFRYRSGINSARKPLDARSVGKGIVKVNLRFRERNCQANKILSGTIKAL